MLSRLAKILLVFGCVFVGVARAGDVILPSDVGVTLTAEPSTGLAAGTVIDVVFTVTNLGSQALPVVSTESNRFVDEFNVVWADPSCFLFLIVEDYADGSYDYLLDWDAASAYSGTAPALEPGEIRTCHFKIALTRSAPSPYVFSFGLADYVHDPNPDNDRVAIELSQTIADALPLPAIDFYRSMILAFLLVAAAIRFVRIR